MSTLFRQLPAIDRVLKSAQGEALVQRFGHQCVVSVCRTLLGEARESIQKTQQLPDVFREIEKFILLIEQRIMQEQQVRIKTVHNLTGTVLHTNLGRAVWAKSAQEAACRAMNGNVALEYDLQAGERGHRDNYISTLLTQLTGAQAACIVNNNAAAVLLMLATFAQGKEVIISRGELIEIGGAFRIPEIMAQAGCHLVEVGTTNRTHLSDYRRAINENTACILKVHSSNYQICGFTASVDEQALCELGQEFNLPVFTDLGSGALIDLTQYHLPAEPTVSAKIADGVALVSFSGDKLLGAPQAGIIVGQTSLIQALQAHPLKRVLRCDKVTLAALEATLRLYLQPEKLRHQLPTLHLLTQPISDLDALARQLCDILSLRLSSDYQLNIEDSAAQIGSGSQPMATIPSVAVTIAADSQAKLSALLTRLKNLPEPIIGRIEKNKLWLDLRSVANPQQCFAMVEKL